MVFGRIVFVFLLCPETGGKTLEQGNFLIILMPNLSIWKLTIDS